MEEIRWAGIVHNILLLKNFTLEHLKAISCDRGVRSQSEDVDEVIAELVAGDFLLKLGPKRKLYHLTTDFDRRLDLLEKVREIERRR